MGINDLITPEQMPMRNRINRSKNPPITNTQTEARTCPPKV